MGNIEKSLRYARLRSDNENGQVLFPRIVVNHGKIIQPTPGPLREIFDKKRVIFTSCVQNGLGGIVSGQGGQVKIFNRRLIVSSLFNDNILSPDKLPGGIR